MVKSWTKIFLGALALSGCAQKNTDGQFVSIADDTKLFQEKNITSFDLRGTKKVVLTFDDGPTPGVTDRILNALKRHRAQGTFFILGKSASTDQGRKILQRMKTEGHIVANHTWNHPNLKSSSLTKPTLLRELVRTHDVLEPFQNPRHGKYFRAPFGAWTKANAARLNNLSRSDIADFLPTTTWDVRDMHTYIGPVFWDIGGDLKIEGSRVSQAADWACWSKKVSAAQCANGYINEIRAKGGGIILMHDLNIQSAELTEILLKWLDDNNYEVISLDQVQALKQYRDNLILKAN